MAESVGGGFSDLLDAAFAALGVGKGRDMKATTRLAMPIPQYLSAYRSLSIRKEQVD